MSLDVSLFSNGYVVYNANITHNLNKMASEAGVYDCLWRPDESGMINAGQIIDPLEKGLALLVTKKAHFEQFNPPNNWGSWEGLVMFCANYLQSCRDNPDSCVEVSR
jgi:hypothetical protein